MSSPVVGQPQLDHALLAGEQVRLRPTRMSDVGPIFELIHGCRAVLDQLIWDGPKKPEDLEDFCGDWSSLSSEGADYHFIIEDRESAQLAGSIALRFRNHVFHGDIGYWLAPRFWGARRGTEAVALIDHLAFRHLAATLLYANVFEGNQPSRRVLEHNGYHEDPTGHSVVVKYGRPQPQWFMCLTRSRYRELCQGFEPAFEDVRLREPAD